MNTIHQVSSEPPRWPSPPKGVPAKAQTNAPVKPDTGGFRGFRRNPTIKTDDAGTQKSCWRLARCCKDDDLDVQVRPM